MNSPIKKYRCAIYTRKSHEEGLEQAFNSLDAQREAGEAYIQSQKHQNWTLIKQHYDDGGVSGGTMERPSLKALLFDIKQNKIDIVVVYKVDRLSRSLGDFAKLMDVFDQHQISFVSVTQQFNTTSSMGRLTLNMLLSFAQFEREVTGERIRDKFAASKKKGLWMGGMPPLGYTIKDRKLIIIKEEADIVQHIFIQYIKDKSPLSTATKLNKQGITTKTWVSQKGIRRGGNRWTPKQVHRVLTNPIYIGKIKHKTDLYKGEHKAIIESDVWQKVQNLITKMSKQQNKQINEFFPLKGLLKTEDGNSLSPSKTKGIRYYVSQYAIKNGFRNCPIKGLNANRIEDLIMAHSLHALPEIIKQHLLRKYQKSRIDAWIEVRSLIDKITISTEALWIHLNKARLDTCSDQLKNEKFYDTAVTQTALSNPFRIVYPAQINEGDNAIILRLNIRIKKHDGKRYILSKDGQPILINTTRAATECQTSKAILKALAEAHVWKDQLVEEKMTVNELAKQTKRQTNFIYHRLKLLSLSPTIIRQVTSNTLSPLISLKNLYQATEQLDWEKQHQFLGIQQK